MAKFARTPGYNLKDQVPVGCFLYEVTQPVNHTPFEGRDDEVFS